ncbi:hypothetical protein [Flavobacterium sp. AJR]|nr:hypothetical protein [Flavobacterium sp. AJR]
MEILLGGQIKPKKDDDDTGGGSSTSREWGCALTGLAAGVAAGLNPLVGGLATAACFLLN